MIHMTPNKALVETRVVQGLTEVPVRWLETYRSLV